MDGSILFLFFVGLPMIFVAPGIVLAIVFGRKK